MERLRCVVERITYRNEQNGYSVIRCNAEDCQDLITVVGAMPDVHVGSVLSMTGEWRLDARYGRQFSIETFEETKQYDEVFSISRTLERIEGNVESAKFYKNI